MYIKISWKYNSLLSLLQIQFTQSVSFNSTWYRELDPFFFLLLFIFFSSCFSEISCLQMASSSSFSNTFHPPLIKIKHLSTVCLDRQNYLIWRAHTLAHLRGYELLQFVEKPVTLSDPTLIQQDQLLLAWLFSTITPSILPQVAASQTSFDAWATLEGIFNTKSKTRVIQLQNELRTLRKDMLSVDEYFVKLNELSEELQ